MSEDVSRRAFLRATGTSALTGAAIATGGSKTPVVKKVVNPVVRKLGPEAKAYRRFLTTIQRQAPYPKKVPFSDLKRVIELVPGSGIYNEAREAFKEATRKKGTPKTYKGSHLIGISNTVTVKTQGPEKGATLFAVHSDVVKRAEDLKRTARTQLATEKRKVRESKKPKKVTKRGIVQRIKSKLKNIKIRGGFGGPGSGKVGIKSRTPERISGYHY